MPPGSALYFVRPRSSFFFEVDSFKDPSTLSPSPLGCCFSYWRSSRVPRSRCRFLQRMMPPRCVPSPPLRYGGLTTHSSHAKGLYNIVKSRLIDGETSQRLFLISQWAIRPISAHPPYRLYTRRPFPIPREDSRKEFPL